MEQKGYEILDNDQVAKEYEKQFTDEDKTRVLAFCKMMEELDNNEELKTEFNKIMKPVKAAIAKQLKDKGFIRSLAEKGFFDK